MQINSTINVDFIVLLLNATQNVSVLAWTSACSFVPPPFLQQCKLHSWHLQPSYLRIRLGHKPALEWRFRIRCCGSAIRPWCGRAGKLHCRLQRYSCYLLRVLVPMYVYGYSPFPFSSVQSLSGYLDHGITQTVVLLDTCLTCLRKEIQKGTLASLLTHILDRLQKLVVKARRWIQVHTI